MNSVERVLTPPNLPGQDDETGIFQPRLTGESKPKLRAKALSPVLAEFGVRRRKDEDCTMCQVGDGVVTRFRHLVVTLTWKFLRS